MRRLKDGPNQTCAAVLVHFWAIHKVNIMILIYPHMNLPKNISAKEGMEAHILLHCQNFFNHLQLLGSCRMGLRQGAGCLGSDTGTQLHTSLYWHWVVYTGRRWSFVQRKDYNYSAVLRQVEWFRWIIHAGVWYHESKIKFKNKK